MLFVLSPAKSLDFEMPMLPGTVATEPRFRAQAAELIGVLRVLRPDDVAGLMHISAALADLNVQRYAAWRKTLSATRADRARPALYLFDGDVYRGLQAATLDADDIAWAQHHLVILSGLYGLLRPLDRVQAHRLEMGTGLRTARGVGLYAYWGDRLAECLNACAAGDATPVVVNLASQEYFRAIDRPALKPRVVHCVFEDWSGGGYRVVGIHAKRARGLMARHAVRQRITTPAELCSFDAEGYAHDADVSSPGRLVFRRRRAAAEARAA